MGDEVKRDYSQVYKARKSFIAIAISYFMGLFNDNFFKEAAVLIAVSMGKYGLQSTAMALFTVCYMLFAAQSGWFADRYSKRNVIIWAKVIELCAMIAGAFGIWYMNWSLILVMIGIMGAQSALFSPAMNGSIPELYPDWYVQKANSVVKVISTMGIFSGMILAGIVMDKKGVLFWNIPSGRALVGIFVLVAGVIGLFVSYWAPRKKAAGTEEKFPLFGPIDSIVEILKIKKDELLKLTVITNCVIWFIASIMTMLIVNLGNTQYCMTNTKIVFLKVVFMTGVALGGVFSNVLSKKYKWYKLLSPMLLGVSLLLMILFFVPELGLSNSMQLIIIFTLVGLVGIFGGIDLIPLESFIQIRPEADRKGRVIAAANFSVFTVMAFAAGILYLMNKYFLPTTSFAILGLFALFFSIWLNKKIKVIKE